ncbi:hypothetical protein G4B88_006525 [Cannabis sativa]|uniref:UBX domain-containing protein n=1 Tax=Cannabis sativa TaxID=3483 RepID=A0A7J6H2K8_CANSA|nr:hypothetical protein G4B88_006525 [Cannabis sativa]
MVDVADKVAYFQAITGLEDSDLCTEILAAHGWDLELAISNYTSPNSIPPEEIPIVQTPSTAGVAGGRSSSSSSSGSEFPESSVRVPGQPGLAWKIITLPISVISGSLGLISGAIGLGLWAAGGVLSYSLGVVGLGHGRNGDSSSSTTPLVSVSAAASEAMEFVAGFERDYGLRRPNFVSEGFMDALQRSRNEFKLLFVYLHSPDHQDTPLFCERTLCSEVLVAFVNENFVSWGGSIRASEGFKMSNSLKASRFPFCAVRVLEESAPVLVTARLDAEERRSNIRLREEQDAAYRAALEADQARERQRKEEQERLEREAAEAERKRKEEEEARERAAREAEEKAAALARIRQEKALSLGAEPEKGPNVTQVLVRFPTGERKERRFDSTATIQTVYDYVDSLGCLEVENYSLVSNFPRMVYGPEKLALSLKEAGLHPQASLFVEPNS